MAGESPARAARDAVALLRSNRPERPLLVTDRFPAGDVGAAGDGITEAPEWTMLLSDGLGPEAWLLLRCDEALDVGWPVLRRAAAMGQAGPHLLAAYDLAGAAPPVPDLAAFGALPRVLVAVPADAAGARAAVAAAEGNDQPVYLRVAARELPAISDGTFAFARAPELRAGTDLTVVAAGPILGAAVALAERLHTAGIETRVLDGASVKPLDTPAVLRAARETGAILTVEEHHALGGLGSAVAAVTSSGYPVPVQRVGFPDLPARLEASPSGPEVLEAYGLSAGRLEEEAWELLRRRGKVH